MNAVRLLIERTLIKGPPLHLHLVIVHHVLHHFVEDLMSRYADMVEALCKPGHDIIMELTADKAHALHMAVGVSGESGELLDCIKKHTMYNKPLDKENLVEELGDIEFYLEGLRQVFGVTREEVLAINQEKLEKRYSSGKYSNQQAQARADKE